LPGKRNQLIYLGGREEKNVYFRVVKEFNRLSVQGEVIGLGVEEKMNCSFIQF